MNYSDAYIAVKWRISVTGTNSTKWRNKRLIFKNNSQFRPSISKVNNTFIGNAEDLDIVMPMYKLLEYIDNYSMTSGTLWNYYTGKVNDDKNENNEAGNYRINSNRRRKVNLLSIRQK